jgi:hypothetical protein
VTYDEARRRRALARWHRRLAAVAGVWLAFLAITGVFINHAHDWGLDRTPLPSSLQRLVYDTDPGADFCERIASADPECRDVFGSLPLPAGELLLGVHKMVMLDKDGRVVEVLSAANLGLERVEAALFREPHVYLRGARRVIRADSDLMAWQALDDETAAGIDAGAWQVRRDSRLAISWERLLLDLHAARFLGPVARYANDLLAGLIIVLALTGLWLYRSKRVRSG